MGLCRDSGLVVLNKVTSQKTDKIRKTIIQIFKDNGFSIGIVTNLVEINFLDVIFNLRNGSYRPYKRPNDKLKYINGLSNYENETKIIKIVPLCQYTCEASNQHLRNKMLIWIWK